MKPNYIVSTASCSCGPVVLNMIHERRRVFVAAIDVATEQGAKSWKLRAAVSLARLYEKHGRREEAHRIVAETYASFTEGMQTADLREAAVLLQLG
jgi:predicted ATPase